MSLYGDRGCFIDAQRRVACFGPDEPRAVSLELPGEARAVAVGASETFVALEDGRVLASDRRPIEGITGALAVSAGEQHACALDGHGSIACWDTSRRARKVDLESATTVAAGARHTCALTERGVFCWGAGESGQLATRVERSERPLFVAGTERARNLTSHGDHTCARIGDEWSCWGSNRFSELGVRGDVVYTPVRLEYARAELALGTHHMCTRDKDTAFCWGQGRYGQLGNGKLEDSQTPVEVRSPQAVRRIFASDWSSCILDIGAELRCFGGGKGPWPDDPMESFTPPPKLTIKGRFVAPMDNEELYVHSELNQYTWAQYNTFKRHFDQNGVPVPPNVEPVAPFIPIPSIAHLEYASAIDGFHCETPHIETDLDGFFTLTYDPTPICGTSVDAVAMKNAEVHSVLGLTMRTGSTTHGKIYGAWRKTDAALVYPGFTFSTEIGDKRVQTEFFALRDVTAAASAGTNAKDLGMISFPNEANPPAEGVEGLRYVLDAWQSFAETVERGRARYAADGRAAEYGKMFPNQNDCQNCYVLTFGGNGAAGGKRGSMLQGTPTLNADWHRAIGSVPHEFGHALHDAMANNTFDLQITPGSFSLQYMWPDQTVTSRLHYATQYQEHWWGLLEGFASGVGDAIATGGDTRWRAPKPPPYNDPTWQNISPACDGTQGCTYMIFRFHLSKRGIAEGSPEWTTRLNAANACNETVVTSNGEGRFALFIADLLREGTDITHPELVDAAVQFPGHRTGIARVSPSFAECLGRAFDGAPVTQTTHFYTENVAPKDFTLSLPTLMDALDTYFDSTVTFPGTGDPTWAAAVLSPEMSTLSPQKLGQHLVTLGLLTKAQVNNVLRANLMEEIP